MDQEHPNGTIARESDEFFRKWVDRLRDPKVKQVFMQLVNLDGDMCAIGQACYIKLGTTNKYSWINKLSLSRGVTGAWLLPLNDQLNIASMNDAHTPFPEIADYIENKYLSKNSPCRVRPEGFDDVLDDPPNNPVG